MTYPSYCGLDCTACAYRERAGCKGCIAEQGALFWGSCPVAACAAERELPHCGRCDEFPCDPYRGMAEDPEHGGDRMETVRRWQQEA